jgi:CelD/BcsL family acetyltransferase involved in cellulose biosynthesis
VYSTNPLTDPRWDELAARHPKASVFHTRGWLKALALTYNYNPTVLTTSLPGCTLENGIVLCRVSSWITGARMVSLPFSDHCDLLVEDPLDARRMIEFLQADWARQKVRYVELRPLDDLNSCGENLQQSGLYCFHTLDLSRDLDELYNKFHKDSVQRRIRKAVREGLSYEVGSSEQQVLDFYRLLIRTRRRHGLFPQPLAWFKNLVRCLGGSVQLYVARKGGIAVAALLSLRHRKALVYKYGCSDERSHHLGAIPFLFWQMIQRGKADGAVSLDLGRSDACQTGLIKFKERFGAEARRLTYYRLGEVRQKASEQACGNPIRHLLAQFPDAVLTAIGTVAYRHLG